MGKKDLLRKLMKIALPWFAITLVLPTIMAVLLTQEPAEAG
jgi:hypothetical protein